MTYIEGVLAAVPTGDRETYRAHAAEVARVFRRHGALRIVECWGDDVPRGKMTDFYRAVQAQENETVVFSWIEWSDRAARDAGMAKVSVEMPEVMKDNPMPFDGKRLVFGGFEAIVDDGDRA